MHCLLLLQWKASAHNALTLLGKRALLAEAYNASTVLSPDAGCAASWPLIRCVGRPLAFFLLLILPALTVLPKSVAGLEACTRARPNCEPATLRCPSSSCGEVCVVSKSAMSMIVYCKELEAGDQDRANASALWLASQRAWHALSGTEHATAERKRRHATDASLFITWRIRGQSLSLGVAPWLWSAGARLRLRGWQALRKLQRCALTAAGSFSKTVQKAPELFVPLGNLFWRPSCVTHLPLLIHELPALTLKQRCTTNIPQVMSVNVLTGLCKLSCIACSSTIRSGMAQPTLDLQFEGSWCQARVT